MSNAGGGIYQLMHAGTNDDCDPIIYLKPEEGEGRMRQSLMQLIRAVDAVLTMLGESENITGLEELQLCKVNIHDKHK